jgi:hypothetical protein
MGRKKQQAARCCDAATGWLFQVGFPIAQAGQSGTSRHFAAALVGKLVGVGLAVFKLTRLGWFLFGARRTMRHWSIMSGGSLLREQ